MVIWAVVVFFAGIVAKRLMRMPWRFKIRILNRFELSNTLRRFIRSISITKWFDGVTILFIVRFGRYRIESSFVHKFHRIILFIYVLVEFIEFIRLIGHLRKLVRLIFSFKKLIFMTRCQGILVNSSLFIHRRSRCILHLRHGIKWMIRKESSFFIF